MTRLYRTWALAAVAAAVLGVGLSAMLGGAFGTAAATGASPSATAPATPISASTAFGCRASVLRASLAGSVLTEPTVANNAGQPCNDASTLISQPVNLLGNSLISLGTVGPAGAYTYETGNLDGTGTPGAAAVATINALSLNIGGYTLSVAGPIQAQTAIECTNTTLGEQYSSNLNALNISGPGLPAGGESLDLGTGINTLVGGLPQALSALISIKANNLIVDSNSVTEQLLNISLLTLGSTPTVNVVLGEATVSVPDTSVCANNVPVPPTTNTVTNTVTTSTTVTGPDGAVTTVTGPSNTVTQPGGSTTITGKDGTATTVTTTTTVLQPTGSVPSTLEICATGSVLDPTTGNCVIYDGTQTIFVSKPFKGPTGGTVVTLAAARSKLSSPCLSGAGPGWALIVTLKNGSATGTPASDRIIGTNSGQYITGLAGDDCIDGQGANAKLKDGNGKDRLYVSTGVNRVIAGNGNNVIHGGNGKDWITDGTGSDTIYGGKLANRIDAYGNLKHIYGGPANDRIWTNSVRAFVSCGGGKADILFGRKGVAAYGKKHSCEKLSLLK
jgi:hypothetical protein